MKVKEIRKAFIDFFVKNGHYYHESFPLVPINDESLLLINAGMAPLKNYFLGLDAPPANRMVTCQKCIRTNDIENVGKTARHATFFEMLGNFSFGDYFKKEAIQWAWKFVMKDLNIDKDLLWVTVFEEDDEALEIWAKEQNVPRDRIVKLGRDDNFWEIGTGTGPSGPCSEIYIDRGTKFGCDNPKCKPGCDCDRFLEFWNLVFTQFDKDENGNYNLLSKPNIDTGMGLERIACILQGVDSIFDIDTMVQIRNKVSQISNKLYGDNLQTDTSIRIITDHTRAITFLISDGIIPSNEGRGYILRRLLRRAARHGKLLGISKPFINDVIEVVVNEYGEAYPEIVNKKNYINKLVSIEEKKFDETIDQGLNILEGHMEKLKNNHLKTLCGEDAFKLYDTFGFPVEITLEILEENGFDLDFKEFEKLMDKQKQTARSARSQQEGEGWKKNIEDEIPTNVSSGFVGYDFLSSESKVTYVINTDNHTNRLQAGDKGVIVLSNTPFYGEGGGQIGDKGTIESDRLKAVVYDTKKSSNGLIIHYIEVIEGVIQPELIVEAKVEHFRRLDTMKNHSATHLLHKTLKMVLGNHVEQAGSFVDDSRLRFDFSHFEGMTLEEIEKVEKLVNHEIYLSLPVTTNMMPISEAKGIGAAAQFNEKYGDIVRVVSMGDFSIELCGGTHVSNTSEIMMFKIINESSVASGIRRIEAITGRNVQNYLYEKELKISSIADILKSNQSSVEQRAIQMVEELKNLKKDISKLKAEASAQDVNMIINSAVEYNGIRYIVTSVNDASVEELRDITQSIVDKIENSLVLVGSICEDKINYVCAVSKVAQNKGAHAGNIVKHVSNVAGGGGGGKPSFAQAGAKELSKFDESLQQGKNIIEEMIR